ncbi:hypothetical protein [Jiangella alkaliphila]|uniref:Uncharacterized protein n=1 Tax=Jiangella alkaliphila TaxID=419479 RepID=A0A1H2JF16_9ACTN|nr:hypothetical protein [Jiangella alkaliphila]SDU54715.1 hypothetical protein SAMN04488563_2601 [Jiangella alkaliphila]
MTTTDTRDRLRRWRTPIVSAAVAGGLLLGGYGIASATESAPTPDTSEPAAPDTESGTPEAPDTTTPEAPDAERPQPGGPGGEGGEGCDEAPDGGQAESSATT